MFGLVSSEHLGVLVETQREAGNLVHGKKQDERNDKRPGATGSSTSELDGDLDPVLVEPATGDDGTVEGSDRGLGKDAGEDASEEAANTVDTKAVESIVVAELVLEFDGKVADEGGQGTNGERRGGRDKAGSRGDADKTSNGARAVADKRPLALADVVEERPDTTGGGGSKVGDGDGHGSTVSGSEGGTAVEAEPAEPEHAGAESNVGDGVGLELVRLAVALADNVGVGEGSETGRDVHDGTAGKVENTESLGPAGRSPSPEGHRVVDDGRPHEDKDGGRDDADTFSSRTEDDGGGLSVQRSSDGKQ